MYTSSKYSPVLIVKAVKLIRSDMSFRKASKACGAPGKMGDLGPGPKSPILKCGKERCGKDPVPFPH